MNKFILPLLSVLSSLLFHNRLAAENLRRVIAGDALLNVVDPELGY